MTESIGTNIGVSTLGAITAEIQHIRNKNIPSTIFIIMALTGAIGAYYDASINPKCTYKFFINLGRINYIL